MASPSNSDFVILELRDPLAIEEETTPKETFIPATEICNWNSPAIPSSQIVKVQANRHRLIQQSSYFRGLLSGSFSESNLGCILIKWNLETIISILKFVNGSPLYVTSNNFLSLLEGALFFGVDPLLLECNSWFSEVTLTGEFPTQQISLEATIEIWNFGLEHEIGFIPVICTGYLARNFMWAMSCSSFAYIPYKLLHSVINHPHLTVDSEKHLCEAVLGWLAGGAESSECTNVGDECIELLKQIRVTLLPLCFAAGERRNRYFCRLADESISAILSLTKDPSMDLLNFLRDGELHNIRLRLTEYTLKADLSGCPQIGTAMLLISMLPCSYKMDNKLRKRIKQCSIELEQCNKYQFPIFQSLFPTLSFEAVRQVDISKCPGLHLEAAIECFSKLFPSLRAVKASYCLNFRIATLHHLVKNCPLVNEVDFTGDITPVISARVSTISAIFEGCKNVDDPIFKLSREGPLLSNITKLTLKGRSEISDLDLQNISALSSSLSYLNLKGCTSLTDLGIGKVICRCMNLQSIIISDTDFGRNSIIALCSDVPSSAGFPEQHHGQNHSISFASRLQKLHIGGCKNIGTSDLLQLMSRAHLIKSLCLREINLLDDALYSFLGSSLERLDISETLVSGAALLHLVRRNPGLKLLKARNCKNLCHQESNFGGESFAPSCYSISPTFPSSGCSISEALVFELLKTGILEEIAFGWGFSLFSLEKLGPAVRSLRTITVGLGASLGQYALMQLSTMCPFLESVILRFQVISDDILKSIVEPLRYLRVLVLCYCLGDLSPVSFQLSMPNLRKLRLEGVTPWMTNDDLATLTTNCKSLIELSLSGCTLLNSDSQQIISRGWSGLISIRLEDCGEVTANGVSSLFDCKAVEDLSLRHNGRGIQRNFILDAASKMPMLRKLALDLCDASEGGFNSPDYANRFFLSTVKIARCKQQTCAFNLQNLEAFSKSVHKETVILEWNSKGLKTTVVKERV